MKNKSELKAGKKNKLAEQKLTDSEARYKRITDGLTDYLYTVKVKDGSAVETIHTEACQAITGYTSQDFKNDPYLWINMIPKEERENVANRFSQILSGKDQPPIEHRIICKDGTIRWVIDTTIPKYDSDGKLIAYDGVIKVISDRKHAEETLKLRESYLTAIIENQPGLVWLKDLDGRFLIANSALARSKGKNSADELLGKTDFDINPIELAEKYRADDISVIQLKKSIHVEEPIYDKNQLIWFETFKLPILDENGEVIGTTGIARDITDRKQAENELIRKDMLLNLTGSTAKVGGWEIDIETMKTIWTEEVYRIYEVDYTYDSNVETGESFYAPKSKPIIENAVQRAIELGEPFDLELEFITAKGNHKWVHSIGKVLQENGKTKKVFGSIQDITERKRAEGTLRASEKRFRQIFQYSATGMVIVATNFKFLQANDAFCKMLGYSEQELLEKTFQDVTFEEDRKRGAELAQNVLAGEAESFQFEKRYLKKDGTIVWGLVNASLIRDAENNPLHFVAQVQNITERKQAESELRISRQLFKNIVDSSPMGLHMYELKSDNNLVFVGANLAAAKILGVDHAQFIGKTIEEAFPGLIQTEVPTRYKETALNGTQWNTQQIDYHEGVIRGAFEVAAFQTEPGKMAAMFVDITERKQAENALKESESRFRIMLQDIENIAVQGYAPDGTTQYWNHASELLYGYTAEEATGRNLLDLIVPPEMRVQVEQAINQMAVSGKPIPASESFLMRKDNSRVPIFSSHVIVKIPGRQQELFCFDLDLTEHKQAEAELEIHRNHLEELVKERTEELNKANQDLLAMIEKEKEFELILQESLEKEKELSEIKSRFISTTSHEFRTPLTTILSSAEMIQRYTNKWSNEKKNEHLERIRSSVSYLTKLLDDILTISKTETGKIQYHPEKINLYNFAEECANETRTVLSSAHELKLNFVSERREFILDAKLMKFIFNNLLSNAAKYSPEGGAIQLTISSSERNLIVEVSDEGIGIPVEEIEKIFESFYRSKNAENIAGTGLGLAIVKRAVDLHEGEITVRSQPGNGTTFVVKIPISSSL